MRFARTLHPAAWWLWALGLAVAASQTTNPLLLVLVLAVVGVVVTMRRTDAPWARGFKYYLALALAAVVIRVVLRSVFGGGLGPADHILFRLPEIPLPSWLSGVQLGGPVSLQATLAACTDGLRLGTILCCIGAANALANPKRALRVLPGALYELGVAVVVAISVAPQLVESVQRVRRARRLRAGHARGLRRLRGIAIPVFEDALERSLRLAAAMDSRGYGRVGTVSRRARRTTGALLLGGLAALCLGMYGLLDATAPPRLGVPAMTAGVLLCGAGLYLGGRRVQRTSYRPDPWRLPEWLVVLSALGPATVLCIGAGASLDELQPGFFPLHWPSLPLLPAAAILLAALAGVAAPPVPSPTRSASGAKRREGRDTSRPSGKNAPLAKAGAGR
jgi:energy-coupling factor transport system permease protein